MVQAVVSDSSSTLGSITYIVNTPNIYYIRPEGTDASPDWNNDGLSNGFTWDVTKQNTPVTPHSYMVVQNLDYIETAEMNVAVTANLRFHWLDTTYTLNSGAATMIKGN